MSETVSQRLQDFFAKRNLSAAQVSRSTGIQYDTLQQILSGKVKAMGVDKFTAIWRAYPDLNAWYVLTGEQLSEQQTSALTTVDELRAFKEQMDTAIEKRIQELSQVSRD